jgi:hypothetical protein
VLSFSGSISYFPLPPNAQCVLQRTVGLAFIQPDLCAALHVCIQQPIDDEERALNATDFTKGYCKIMLAWVGGELSQELAGRHDTSHHGCRTAQDIRPVCHDRAFSDFAANQPLQFLWDAAWIKYI